MPDHPLRSPADDALVRRFAAHLQLAPPDSSSRSLVDYIEGFARLPYENLTKVVRFQERGSIVAARRTPEEVIEDHIRWGTGGTCFSLTATLLHLLRAMGYVAEPILADRPYGPHTHCALLVWLDAAPHLVDPGFLINRPIPLPTTEPVAVATRFNQLLLEPRLGGSLVDLYTLQQSQRKLRVTFRTSPVDAGEFLRVWDASFDWEMMKYPVVTQVVGDEQRYWRERRYQVRNRAAAQVIRVPPAGLERQLAATFGIDPAIVARALAIWRRQGELNGDSKSS